MNREIIEKGMQVVPLAKEYGCNPSNMGSLLKRKEAISRHADGMVNGG